MRRSRGFWALVIVASLYFVSREAAQLALHAGWWDLTSAGSAEVSSGAASVEEWLGRDLRIVVDAAWRLVERDELYPTDKWVDTFDEYNYTPFYALLISQIATRLPFAWHALLHGLLSLAAYAALFLTWRHLFPALGAPRAADMLVSLLPVWLIYTAWWGDAILLNLYVILAVAVSWLFYFIWQGRLGPAAVLLIAILQVKPQWAFALALPLLLGRTRFFFKLLALVAAGYLAAAASTVWLLGADYGLAQYAAYYRMLAIAPYQIPWHGPGEYIGYDHSIAQIYFYLFGYREAAWPIVRAVKAAILLPLAAVAIPLIRRNQAQPHLLRASLAVEVFFALYFAAFIWLDLVWETTLSIVVFAYLWAQLADRRARWLVGLPFMWYAVADVWQLIGIPAAAAVWGASTVASQGPPLWADPSFRVPIIMVVILVFYGVLLVRLWQPVAVGQTSARTVAEG
jgi:hypothetical protein